MEWGRNGGVGLADPRFDVLGRVAESYAGDAPLRLDDPIGCGDRAVSTVAAPGECEGRQDEGETPQAFGAQKMKVARLDPSAKRSTISDA
jgi:hypothetical protein